MDSDIKRMLKYIQTMAGKMETEIYNLLTELDNLNLEIEVLKTMLLKTTDKKSEAK